MLPIALYARSEAFAEQSVDGSCDDIHICVP